MQSAVGSRQSASRQSAVGSRQSAVGSRQSAVGSRQSAVGSRQSAKPLLAVIFRAGREYFLSSFTFSPILNMLQPEKDVRCSKRARGTAQDLLPR